MAMAGGQMLLGIRLQLSASGVVSGANQTENALGRISRKATETQRNVGRSATGMGQILRNAMGLGALGGAPLGLGMAVKSKFLDPSIEQAKTFQQEMALLGFNTKATGKELDKFRDVAIKTGLETQYSPQQAANAMRILKAAGLSNTKMLEALNPALDVAIGSKGMLGLAEATGSVATAVAKFNHTGESSRQMMDKFAASTRETKMQFEDLPQFLDSLRAAPGILKATFGEIVTVGGALRTYGLSAAEAGQAIKGFADNLFTNQKALNRYLMRNKLTLEEFYKLDESKITKGRGIMRVRALHELGISIFDTQGKLKKFNPLIKELVESLTKIEGTKSEERFLSTLTSAFGSSAKTMLIAIKSLREGSKKGVPAFEQLFNTINKNKGASREVAAAIENTALGLDKFIEGTKETINVIIGTSLLGGLHSFATVLREILNGILGFLQKHPTFTKALAYFAVVIVGVTTAFGGAVLALAGFMAWAAIVQPMLISMGGAAGIAAAGFKVLRMVIGKVIAIAKPMIGLFLIMWLASKIWAKIWEENASGIWKKIQTTLTNLKILWESFSKGIFEGIGIFFEMMGEIFDNVVRSLVFIQKSIKDFLGITEIKNHKTAIEETAKAWRFFGRIVGLLVGAWMVKFAISSLSSLGAIWKLSYAVYTFAATSGPAFGKALLTAGSNVSTLAQSIGSLTKTMAVGLVGGIKKAATASVFFVTKTIPRMLIGLSQWFLSLGKIILQHTILAFKAMAQLTKKILVFIITTIPKLIASLAMWAFSLGTIIVKYAILAGAAFIQFLAAVPAMLAAIGSVTIAWLTQAAAMLVALAPYILIGAAIAAVVAALVLLGIEIWKARDAIWDALISSYHIVRDYLTGLWDDLKSWFSDLIDSAWDWGVGLWTSFRDGMASSWEGVKTWFSSIVQWIRDMLPGSNAKIGPLSTLTSAGNGLMTAFKSGAEEKAPEMRSSIESVVGTTRDVMFPSNRQENYLPSTPSSESKTINIDMSGMNVTVGNADDKSATDFVHKIAGQLREYFDNDTEVSFG